MEEGICPHCKKPIYDDEATLCLFCGESLDRPIGFFGKVRYSKPPVMAISIALLLLLCFIIMILL